jgi:hypothetical protein
MTPLPWLKGNIKNQGGLALKSCPIFVKDMLAIVISIVSLFLAVVGVVQVDSSLRSE